MVVREVAVDKTRAGCHVADVDVGEAEARGRHLQCAAVKTIAYARGRDGGLGVNRLVAFEYQVLKRSV